MSLLLEKFLNQHNYTSFSRNEILLQIQTHPKNPSFKSIKDTLDYFGIDNIAVNVPEDSISLLPNVFLTVIGERESKQLVLVNKDERNIIATEETGNKIKLSYPEFLKLWNKEVIIIEKKNSIYKINYKVQFLVVLYIFFFVLYLYFKENNIFEIYRFILAGVGIYISYILVIETLGLHTKLAQVICTAIPNGNCHDVLNSKRSKVFKNVFLADICFIFFSLLFLQNIFFNYNGITSILLISSTLVVPILIYFQVFVLKKICALCLCVGGLLFALNVPMLFNFDLKFTFLNLLEIGSILLFLIPAYFSLKNFIINEKNNFQEIITYRKFKRSPSTISKFVTEVKTNYINQEYKGEIILGNKHANHQIIGLTNPLCGFCEKAFESYLQIIKNNYNVRVLLRFNINTEDLDANATKISIRLVELFESGGEELFIKGYKDWFKDKNYNRWLSIYGENSYRKESESLLKNHKKWIESIFINYTPATFIDGKIFPIEYDYHDLPFVLETIIGIPSEKKMK